MQVVKPILTKTLLGRPQLASKRNIKIQVPLITVITHTDNFLSQKMDISGEIKIQKFIRLQ